MPTHTLAFAAGIGFGLLIAYLVRRVRRKEQLTLTVVDIDNAAGFSEGDTIVVHAGDDSECRVRVL